MKTRFTSKTLVLIISLLFFASAVYAQPTFINQIPIPPLIDAADGTIELEMRQFYSHQFNPGDPLDTLNGTANQAGISTFAYNSPGDSTMTVLGPTLKWHSGDQIHIKVTNLLPDTTTTHWHGAEVPAKFDGGPHQTILQGTTWDIEFTNLDPACTMWYHPHMHNKTLPQVQMGLSGMIISQDAFDPIRPVLPGTYGVDDIPVIISDLNVKLKNNNYEVVQEKGRRPYNLVNGVTNPYLEVPNALVRLRILNGSTRKGMHFGVATSYLDDDINNFEDMVLIATDGGYTLKPDTLKTLLNGPGGRDEIVLDLTDYIPGDVLYLRNLKETMPNSVIGSAQTPPGNPNGGDPTIGKAFLQLRVIDKNSIANYDPIDSFTPFITGWVPELQDTMDIDRRRTKNLVGENNGSGFTIDGETYKLTVINDTICVGAKEIWTIHNQSPIAHPFHIHKIFFRILDIIDEQGNPVNLESRGLNGPKDDALILPGWKLRFMAKFDDFPTEIAYDSTYMYHCHILTHEDAEGGGMMHQFVVTDNPACDPTSIDQEPLIFKEMTLYPNPATFELFLKASSNVESRVQILDLHGRILKDQTLPPFEEQTAINIDELPPGFYVVSWRTEDGMASRKLILH